MIYLCVAMKTLALFQAAKVLLMILVHLIILNTAFFSLHESNQCPSLPAVGGSDLSTKSHVNDFSPGHSHGTHANDF